LITLYNQTLRLFSRKNGAADREPALCAYLLVLCGAVLLLGAVHPLCAMLLMAPLFGGLSAFPPCVHMEHELDSGKFAGDIPVYEALVRETCLSVAPAFSGGIIAPLLLCAAGMPLHAACPIGYAYAALRALSPQDATARRVTHAVERFSERVLIFFMTLCSGVTGRNPLRARGKTGPDRLLSILGIAGDHTDTHAPMAGDIAQAIFLCSFSTGILCLSLCAVGFVLCR